MSGLLWLQGPQGDLFLAKNWERALTGLYPEIYVDQFQPGSTVALRREQRDRIALRSATEMQGLQALVAVDDGLFDPEVADEKTLTAIFADRSEPAPMEAWAWWLGDRLPLILTSNAVALRDREHPTGDGVTVIDSRTSHRLIITLAEAGAIRYGVL